MAMHVNLERFWKAAAVAAVVLLPALLVRADENGGPMTLDRVMDNVVIAGKDLKAVNGADIEALRLMSFKDGKLAPVPFQVDEKTPVGEYVMIAPDGSRGHDDGKLDLNDELVFMAKDAGDRGDPSASGLDPEAWNEIALTDPVTGGKGWAYLIAFDENPPALSPVRYMTYQELADHDELTTPYYSLRFPKNNVFMSDIIITKAAGGNGQDILDKIKMRSGVAMLRGAFSVDRTEEDFSHKVLGVLTGPVRVIRRTETRLSLILSLKSPAAIVNGSFYPACFQFPSMLSLPFRMDMIASDAYMRQGWDLNRNAIGLKFYSNLNPEPVVYDGKMGPAEQKLAANRNTLRWALGTGPQGTFMFEGEWDQKSPIKALLYYEDDLSRAEPPEDDPGIMGIAYRLEDLLKMGGDEYPFNIVNYIVPNFDGDIQKALRVFDHPLEVKVKGESSK
ncbi:MAG TPA: hypothetical protein VM658_14220 [bacterium]|nr:hypothetical protein [bacterium]